MSDIQNIGPHFIGIATVYKRRKSDVQNVGPHFVGIATVYKLRKSDVKNVRPNSVGSATVYKRQKCGGLGNVGRATLVWKQRKKCR